MKKKVTMSIEQFLKEHEKLLRILKSGSKEEQLEEAKEQEEEVKKEKRKK
jgi:hypothetical protein